MCYGSALFGAGRESRSGVWWPLAVVRELWLVGWLVGWMAQVSMLSVSDMSDNISRVRTILFGQGVVPCGPCIVSVRGAVEGSVSCTFQMLH